LQLALQRRQVIVVVVVVLEDLSRVSAIDHVAAGRALDELAPWT
jgi:hypothetical protein